MITKTNQEHPDIPHLKEWALRTFLVKAAIENTMAKVDETIAALNNGADNEVVAEMISDARQLQKDIANNVLDLKRNQASNVLKQARIAIKNNDLEAAKESLSDAANRYKEIQHLYAANH
ncbi:MAG: hypothetical protein Q7U18_06550 [Methylobacter sp.]|nr:hypothetical protein [Methylobacter sp.]